MERSAYEPGATGPLAEIGPLDVELYEDDAYESIGYDEYERLCKLREEENDRYLDEFYDDLVKAGLKEKTVSKHIDNLNFYLNTYLTRSAPLDMRAGCYKASDFLGNFFIRKCMWSTPTTIKGNAASFKKFYKSMLERGRILQDDYDFLRCVIKDDLDYWCELCAEYNTPGSANPFDPFADDPFYMDDLGGNAGGDDETLSALHGMVDELISSMRAEGLSDEDIAVAMAGATEAIEERIALYEADDATVMAALASTGIPAIRPELEELMRENDSPAPAIDALCEKHGVELDEDAYGMAEWTIAILHDRWIAPE